MDLKALVSSSSSPPPPTIPPTMSNNSQAGQSSASNYGGIDPEIEENLGILSYVSDAGLRNDATDQRKMLDSSREEYYPIATCAGGSLVKDTRLSADCPLLSLPLELVDSILSYLSPHDLAFMSATCRNLRTYASSDIHWYERVQANVPGVVLNSPYPCQTYRELYGAHHARWFLPRYKIWFCDRDLMGKMIVTRYDQRRGCIEGYQLLAISSRTTYQHWSADSQVVIHAFEPNVKLHLDKPVLQFHIRGLNGQDDKPGGLEGSKFVAEVPMVVDARPDTMFSNFMLAKPLDPSVTAERLSMPFPYGNVWPPPSIPARHRVAGAPPLEVGDDLLPTDAPTRRAEASDQTFRIRQWMEMSGNPTGPGVSAGRGLAGMVQVLAGMVPRNDRPNGLTTPAATAYGSMGVHIGEEIITYSTLDPVLYTPTALKPWRGIWVGDYSGHGCEFLLVNQPDDEPVTDEELGLIRGVGETDEEWSDRCRDARVYRGRLEAIKLTGDPNVPRGEYTFVADDLGEAGFVGFAKGAPFDGTRVVKSRGHVAGAGFRNDKYIESQLMLVSKDRLAQYWVGFGHISFFERVDINKFLQP